MAFRVAVALDRRTPLPRPFLDEVLSVRRFRLIFYVRTSSLLSHHVKCANVMHIGGRELQLKFIASKDVMVVLGILIS